MADSKTFIPVDFDINELFDGGGEGKEEAPVLGLPADDTPIAVVFTAAYWSKALTGNEYVSLNGQVVAPAEFYGLTVRKSPLMVLSTPQAVKAKNSGFTTAMCNLQANLNNKEWPKRLLRLLATVMGKDKFEQSLRETGGLNAEFVKKIRGDVAWVLSKTEKDTRNNSQYLSFSIVKERTTLEDLGIDFANDADLGGGDGDEPTVY